MNLWFRNAVGQNIFVGVQLECEDDIDTLYYMKSVSPHTTCEIYVEVEPQTRHVHSDHDSEQTSLVENDFEKKSNSMLHTAVSESARMVNRSFDELPQMEILNLTILSSIPKSKGVNVDQDTESEPDGNDSGNNE